ncbi:MAG: hypothetical protein H7Z72_07450 [Bacteroidetes bacterium]|nr:hypothetical protein [Fibrella sp.]
MESTPRTSQLLTAALVAGLFILLGVGYYYATKSSKLLTQKDRMEQRADSLLSAKLQLEGDVRLLNNQLTTAREDNTSLTKNLGAVNQRLASSQVTQQALRRTNTRRTLTIGDLNRNLTRLSTTRDSLTSQMNAMHEKINWQQDSVGSLSKQRDELTQQINSANARLLTMVPRSALTGDNFRVDATKANDKATAKAKKVNTLTVSLDLPAGLDLTGTHEVYLSLTNNQHKAMMTPLSMATVALPDVNEVVPVHVAQPVDFDKNPRNLSFAVTPTGSVQPGLYRASVYTKNAYLGSVQFEFRDSFWFF